MGLLLLEKNNTIFRILNDFGEHVERDDMAEVLLSYFRNLFASSSPLDMNGIFSLVGQCITDDIQVYLSHDFTEDEVLTIMKQMPLMKSPYPNGMTTSFYKNH